MFGVMVLTVGGAARFASMQPLSPPGLLSSGAFTSRRPQTSLHACSSGRKRVRVEAARLRTGTVSLSPHSMDQSKSQAVPDSRRERTCTSPRDGRN